MNQQYSEWEVDILNLPKPTILFTPEWEVDILKLHKPTILPKPTIFSNCINQQYSRMGSRHPQTA
jgi:hypothetical protein